MSLKAEPADHQPRQATEQSIVAVAIGIRQRGANRRHASRYFGVARNRPFRVWERRQRPNPSRINIVRFIRAGQPWPGAGHDDETWFRCPISAAMGLDPAIPTRIGIAKVAVRHSDKFRVDGRAKPGHDGWGGSCGTSTLTAAWYQTVKPSFGFWLRPPSVHPRLWRSIAKIKTCTTDPVT
jgi:hypothetical protein